MPTPPGEAPASPAVSPARKRRSNLWAALGIGIIALILIAGVVGSLSTAGSGSSPKTHSTGTTVVNITQVNWVFTGPSLCWANATGPALAASGGGTFTVDLTLTYHGTSTDPGSCSLNSETVRTAGFGETSANTPLVVPRGSSRTASVQLSAPDQNETTSLTLAGIVSEGATTATTTVNVTSVNWEFSGPSYCWGTMSGHGAVATGGGKFSVTVSLSYSAFLLEPASCTVQSVSVGTAGFSLASSNAPLVVESGGSQTLWVSVTAPNENESAVLTIDATATAP